MPLSAAENLRFRTRALAEYLTQTCNIYEAFDIPGFTDQFYRIQSTNAPFRLFQRKPKLDETAPAGLTEILTIRNGDIGSVASSYTVLSRYAIEITTAGHPYQGKFFIVEGNPDVVECQGVPYRFDFICKHAPRSMLFESTWGFTAAYPEGASTQDIADYLTGFALPRFRDDLELPAGSFLRSVASNNSTIINAMIAFCDGGGYKMVLTQDPSDTTGANIAAVALALGPSRIACIEGMNEMDERGGWDPSTGYPNVFNWFSAMVAAVRAHPTLASVDIACPPFAPIVEDQLTLPAFDYAGAGATLANQHDYTSLKPASPASTPTVADGNANVAMACAYNIRQAPTLAQFVSEFGYRVLLGNSRPETVPANQYGTMMLALGKYMASAHPTARMKCVYKLNRQDGEADLESFGPFNADGTWIDENAKQMKGLWGKAA